MFAIKENNLQTGKGRIYIVQRKLESKIEKVILRKHLVSPLRNFVSPEPVSVLKGR